MSLLDRALIELSNVTGLTIGQLRGCVNGCGPEGLGLLMPDIGLTEECCLHDLCYSFGKHQTLKKAADARLLKKASKLGPFVHVIRPGLRLTNFQTIAPIVATIGERKRAAARRALLNLLASEYSH